MSQLRDFYQDGDNNIIYDNIYCDAIDVSTLDFNCQETCFLDISEAKGISNLISWLKDQDTKRLIDTRTWTRAKKRYSRLSIDSIPEVAASLENSPIKPRTSHLITSTPHVPQLASSRLNFDFTERINVVPSVLRSSSSAYSGSNFGQTSLETLLNMSQQNGVDSFINMDAPELNESLLINNKQPPSLTDSLLMIEDSELVGSTHSSLSCFGAGVGIRSVGTGVKSRGVGVESDEVGEDSSAVVVGTSAEARRLESLENGPKMDDSQILTTSMMQTSLFSDTMDTNNPFARDLSDGSCIENPNYSSLNNTITVNNSAPKKKIDATFNADELYAALNNESFLINRTFDNNEANHLSYVICREDSADLSVENKTYSSKKLNLQLNKCSKIINCSEEILGVEVEEENLMIDQNLENKECDIKVNTTIELSDDLNSTFTVDDESLPSDGFKEPLTVDNQKCLNSTFVAENNKVLNETYNNENEEDANVMKNRYQTYRKPVPSKMLLRKTFGFHMQDTRSLENLADRFGNKKSGGAKAAGVGKKSFSRLPQSLQKSNPNLNSGLKLVPSDSKPRSGLYGFRNPRTGNAEGDGLDKKSKYKFAQGSTESIESTQSIASAPDLDDCLSADSDDKDFKDRKIMENTWIADPTDLPSPILKDGEVPSGSRGSLNEGNDSHIKTSSPIISPSSSQSNDSTYGNVKPAVKPCLPPKQTSIEKSIKNNEKPEMKSGIRPPSARALSGIPRPASRIPAPGFTRSNFAKKNLT
ncbi:uncharacterized protein LOC123263116 isoform X1 [Cotesia glomerata]|uniref:uncharacterized protein LOC123263116 isoform X1 n=1 Tax=Cotesia glomerata TaxID=32391 RepID=UPI001D0056F8|nr:uncharacterized protein LOC123263116 isoform X1 [Cotesia glomerata]